MWNNDKNIPARGFSTPPPTWNSRTWRSPRMPMSERKRSSPGVNKGDIFHVIHKVPSGDSPYVKAKQVQLIEKDPSKAISLFWAAINAGDRVDSALKDMAIVMKQLDRSDEAIEAIKSFRRLCPYDSQESIDNVLVELYKRSGRIEEEIEMLQVKLKQIEEGIGFNGRRTKTARSQGKKVQISIEQERSRILGNLAWAYMQQHNYGIAEQHYRKALCLEADKNKQCNLAICLMHMNRLAEAKSLIEAVRISSGGKPMDESYAKSYERALQMLNEQDQNYSSPSPAKGNLQVPFTQPRQCPPWGFSDRNQQHTRNWRHDVVTSSNRRLSFEHSTLNQNPRANDANVYQNPIVGPVLLQRGLEGNVANKSDVIRQSKTDNDDRSKLDLSNFNGKKSWADMVEEEEEDVLRSDCSVEEMFNDENLNFNINRVKLEEVDVKDEFGGGSGDVFSSRNQAVRRSLGFNNIDPSLQGSGKDSSSMSGENVKMLRRNRLQVFKDSTIQQESP